MKPMLPIALAGFLALPTHVHAGPAVDCGSFPNSQMRLTCWNDTSRALQAYNPGQMPNDTPSLRAGRANARPMTGSAEAIQRRQELDCFVASAPRNDG